VIFSDLLDYFVQLTTNCKSFRTIYY